MKYIIIIILCLPWYLVFAQQNKFKLIYGNKATTFSNFDTINAKVFEQDSVIISPDFDNPIYKYSFSGGSIVIKSLYGKSNDTINYFFDFTSLLSQQSKHFILLKKPSEIAISTNLKTTIANYKTEIAPYNIYIYLR